MLMVPIQNGGLYLYEMGSWKKLCYGPFEQLTKSREIFPKRGENYAHRAVVGAKYLLIITFNFSINLYINRLMIELLFVEDILQI